MSLNNVTARMYVILLYICLCGWGKEREPEIEGQYIMVICLKPKCSNQLKIMPLLFLQGTEQVETVRNRPVAGNVVVDVVHL